MSYFHLGAWWTTWYPSELSWHVLCWWPSVVCSNKPLINPLHSLSTVFTPGLNCRTRRSHSKVRQDSCRHNSFILHLLHSLWERFILRLKWPDPGGGSCSPRPDTLLSRSGSGGLYTVLNTHFLLITSQPPIREQDKNKFHGSFGKIARIRETRLVPIWFCGESHLIWRFQSMNRSSILQHRESFYLFYLSTFVGDNRVLV